MLTVPSENQALDQWRLIYQICNYSYSYQNQLDNLILCPIADSLTVVLSLESTLSVHNK